MMHKVRFESGEFVKPGFQPHTPLMYEDLHGTAVDSNDDVFDDDDEDDEVMSVHQSKPLMYQRQRPTHVRTVRPNHSCRQRVKSAICFMVFAIAMVAMAGFVVYAINKRLLPMSSRPHQPTVSVTDIWVTGLAKLTTESAIRLVDVNQDGILDVLIGFGTGADGHNVPGVVCDVYFNSNHPCLGGLIVLDGQTGDELWRHYTPHEIFALNCHVDLDGDSSADCLIAGRSATFEAVNPRTKRRIWTFRGDARVPAMNLYTPLYVSDLDGDGVPDVVNIHGGDPAAAPGDANRLAARIILFSGRDGSVLRWMEVPERRESYFSPVSYRKPDGSQMILIGTGGETLPGGLWAITLNDLRKGNIHKAYEIYHDDLKGVMTPPVLVDLTADGVDDIVFSTFNSAVLAYDGNTYNLLWNFTQPGAETYVTPAPGHYNDDDIPDFMVQWQHGPGYPVYYYATTTIIDGRTGKALLKPDIRSTIGTQASPLTISIKGHGNDLFLFWLDDCEGYEGRGDKFQFKEGTDISKQSRTDFCRLRFGAKGFSKLLVLNRQLQAPGAIVYNSGDRISEEHSAWVDTVLEGSNFLQAHPQLPLHPHSSAIHQQTPIKSNRPSNGGSQSNVYTTIRKHGDIGRYHVHPPPPHQLNTHYKSTNNYPSDYDDDDGWNEKSAGMSSRHYHPSRDADQLYERILNLFDDRTPKSAVDRDQKDNRAEDSREIQTARMPRGRRLQSQQQNIMRGSQRAQHHYQPYMGRQEQSRTADSSKDRYNVPYQRQSHVGYNERHKKTDRHKRDVSVHDHIGVQRLISTGSLAPSLLPKSDPDYERSIDVIFATYWFYPADTEALLSVVQNCVETMTTNQSTHFDPTNVHYKLNPKQYEHRIIKECLQHGETKSVPILHNEYDPYHIRMGQMTVYRLRLKYTTGNISDLILPFSQQQWSAYMGSNANSHYKIH